MTNLLTKGILDFFENVGLFWQSQTIPSRLPFIILDILIVSALFYWIYVLIRETRAWRIFLGLILVFTLFILSKLLGLSVVSWLFKNLFTVLIVAIPVVFQPELRAALEKLGRIKLSEFPKERKLDEIVDQIVGACRELSKRETGALIVIQREDGLREYIETGTVLNADLSSALLLNIFQKKSSFHDGAVVVVGNKVKAVSCLLPIEKRRPKQSLGTRHNAAITLSRETDAIVIIVSEERGEISIALKGRLKEGVSHFDLKQILLIELKGKKNEKAKS